MMKTLRVGIIGGGKIVECNHLPVLLSHPGASVEWVADISAERRKLLERMYSVKTVDASSDLTIALSQIDVCLVATPVGVRQEYLERCAKEQIQVLCEKPFALNLDQHNFYESIFTNSDLAICYQRRYNRPMMAMKRLCQEETFGELKEVKLFMGGYDLKSGGASSYLARANLSGGGILIEYGVHGLDLLAWCLDATSQVTKNVQGHTREGIDYEVSFESLLSSAKASYPVRVFMSRLRPVQQGIHFCFAQAEVVVGLGAGSHIQILPTEGTPYSLDLTREQGAQTDRESFYLMWSEFLEAQNNAHQAPPTSAKASILVSQWIDDVYLECGAGSHYQLEAQAS